MTGLKKKMLATSLAVMMFSVTVMAASLSLNGGGATWSGGESSSGILYSQLVDNRVDGVKYRVKVWVESDDGARLETTDTTTGRGTAGRVYISKGATHKNPFVVEKSGYNNFVAVAVKSSTTH